ncbi:DUF2917 domain-containing protein [Anaeromyxobacter terrae]|uniref:DUF2917 domain-containing protein n=1 Tax=Anaeromyxobacter terrae TaxID=2925406 RepID=UPI001F5957B9|nr:DUF2917 domain-containing protein [Anaeromyxobacter sp. SG22]
MATTKMTALPRTGVARKLDEDAAMRLWRGGAATVVRVERGTVLVTQEGDLDDHVLEPGDELVLDGEGLAVAWAFTEAVISVREAAQRGSTTRTASSLDGDLSPAPRAT